MMSLDEIDEWERARLLEHDLSDLADCVQLLRTLAWAATLSIDPPLPPKRAFVWFEDLHEFPETIDLLVQCGVEASTPEARALCSAFARLYRAVHGALTAGPRRPSADEVVQRYASGQIGDRTARYLMGWDAFELIEECQKRGLPPIQMGDGR